MASEPQPMHSTIHCGRSGCGWHCFVTQDIDVMTAVAVVVALGGQATATNNGELRSYCSQHADRQNEAANHG